MAPRGEVGLKVRIGTDLATLADDLCARLSTPTLPVFTPEVVVVPTPGIRQWLELRLARTLGAAHGDDGISANVEFLFFGGLLRRVVGRGGSDDWSLDRLTLLTLDLLATAPEGTPLAALRPPLGAPGLFAVARGAADLFDQLFRWRPDVAQAWVDDPTVDRRAPLLAALTRRIGGAAPWRDSTRRLAELLAGDDQGLDLPARVHLFGGDTLPGGPLLATLLDALGMVRDVSMHVVVASVEQFEAIRVATPLFASRAPDRGSLDEVDGTQPLVSAWGTTGRETAMLLAQLPARLTTSFVTVPPGEEGVDSLLHAVQAAIRGSASPTASVAADRSIEVHGCVGDLRQVEVVRDAILHALADDPQCRPSDVVLLCPDLPRFAPLVDAVLSNPHGAPRLPYLLRDRSLASAIPLIASTSRALGLLGGRFPRSDVLDLVRDPFVRRRFDLTEEDVDRFAEWTDDGIVRWGLDGERRSVARLPERFEAGTWRRALDRLLVGAALKPGTIAPTLELRALDPGYDLERIGALSAIVATIARFDEEAVAARSLAHWCAFARALVDGLFDAGADVGTQLERLHRILAAIEEDAHGLDEPLAFYEFRALFDDRALDERTVAANGPGGLTVTSLVPLRNVPFRIVAILGLDERSLQRSSNVDVAFGPPRVGDRDRRADVRSALLGAVLAARTRLIVTHEDADVVTNHAVPASSALTELVEAIDRVCADGVDAVLHHHSRHAHGVGELRADARYGGTPFSFDGGALQRANELRVPAGSGPLGWADHGAVRPAAAGPIDLVDLVEFLHAPQRTYLRESLGVWVPNNDEPPGDDLATSLDNLEKWNATTDLVREGRGMFWSDELDPDAWDAYISSWAMRPDSPVAGLAGRLALDAVRGKKGAGGRAEVLLRQVLKRTRDQVHEPCEASATLSDGTVLHGAPLVYGGDTIVHWTASSSEGRVRLDATIELLVLTVSNPEVPWRAVRIWRSGDNAKSKVSMIGGASAEERRERAVRSLERLVDLRRRGLESPVPLFMRVTHRLLASLEHRPGLTAEQLLVDGLGGWEVYNSFGDGDEAAVRFCFPLSYEALCRVPPIAGDPAPRRDTGDSRLLAYSLTLCEALLDLDADHEGEEDR